MLAKNAPEHSVLALPKNLAVGSPAAITNVVTSTAANIIKTLTIATKDGNNSLAKMSKGLDQYFADMSKGNVPQKVGNIVLGAVKSLFGVFETVRKQGGNTIAKPISAGIQTIVSPFKSGADVVGKMVSTKKDAKPEDVQFAGVEHSPVTNATWANFIPTLDSGPSKVGFWRWTSNVVNILIESGMTTNVRLVNDLGMYASIATSNLGGAVWKCADDIYKSWEGVFSSGQSFWKKTKNIFTKGIWGSIKSVGRGIGNAGASVVQGFGGVGLSVGNWVGRHLSTLRGAVSSKTKESRGDNVLERFSWYKGFRDFIQADLTKHNLWKDGLPGEGASMIGTWNEQAKEKKETKEEKKSSDEGEKKKKKKKRTWKERWGGLWGKKKEEKEEEEEEEEGGEKNEKEKNEEKSEKKKDTGEKEKNIDEEIKQGYYTGKIKPGDPNTIFVFGSNLEGNHAGGNAKAALDSFGANEGQATGLQGQAYAIPTTTKAGEKKSLSREKIIDSIKEMYVDAAKMPQKKFKVAYMDTTKELNSGYTGLELLDMFVEAGPIPNNVLFSKEWYDTGKIERKKSSNPSSTTSSPSSSPSSPDTGTPPGKEITYSERKIRWIDQDHYKNGDCGPAMVFNLLNVLGKDIKGLTIDTIRQAVSGETMTNPKGIHQEKIVNYLKNISGLSLDIAKHESGYDFSCIRPYSEEKGNEGKIKGYIDTMSPGNFFLTTIRGDIDSSEDGGHFRAFIKQKHGSLLMIDPIKNKPIAINVQHFMKTFYKGGVGEYIPPKTNPKKPKGVAAALSFFSAS